MKKVKKSGKPRSSSKMRRHGPVRVELGTGTDIGPSWAAYAALSTQFSSFDRGDRPNVAVYHPISAAAVPEAQYCSDRRCPQKKVPRLHFLRLRSNCKDGPGRPLRPAARLGLPTRSPDHFDSDDSFGGIAVTRQPSKCGPLQRMRPSVLPADRGFGVADASSTLLVFQSPVSSRSATGFLLSMETSSRPGRCETIPIRVVFGILAASRVACNRSLLPPQLKIET